MNCAFTDELLRKSGSVGKNVFYLIYYLVMAGNILELYITDKIRLMA